MEIKNRFSQKMWNIIDATVIAVAVFIFFIVTTCGCTAQRNGEIHHPELMESDTTFRTIALRAHDVLYRVWLDHPSYVEDVLCESSEWDRLVEVEDAGLSKLFEFRSKEDSIYYMQSVAIDKERALSYLKHKFTEPDEMPFEYEAESSK